MYKLGNDRLETLRDLPAPSTWCIPQVAVGEDAASLSYLDADQAKVEVAFSCPFAVYLGPPNDEALCCHPLAVIGLQSYACYKVERSSWVSLLQSLKDERVHAQVTDLSGFSHFIVTFHDCVFECIATGVVVQLPASNQ